jgi:hypothetical protein
MILIFLGAMEKPQIVYFFFKDFHLAYFYNKLYIQNISSYEVKKFNDYRIKQFKEIK